MKSAQIITPVGTFDVGSIEGERMLEQAVQTGERHSFKADNGSGAPVTLTGRVRRHASNPLDYVMDLSVSSQLTV